MVNDPTGGTDRLWQQKVLACGVSSQQVWCEQGSRYCAHSRSGAICYYLAWIVRRTVMQDDITSGFALLESWYPSKLASALRSSTLEKIYTSGKVPSKCVTASKACCAVIRQSLHEERHDFFERCCCHATSSCRINHHRHSICIHSRGRVVRAEQYVHFVFG